MGMIKGVTILGFIGHLVSKGAAYHSLEGPVFGTRIGIYHNVTADISGAFICLQQDQYDKENGHYLVLYKVLDWAEDLRNEDEYSILQTVPKAVNKQLQRLLDPPFKKKESRNFPLASIPEDAREDPV